MSRHYCIHAKYHRDRELARAALELPPVLAVVNGHRFRRGPYTAAGDLLRTIGHDLLRRQPELGPRYNVEILTAAPEFADLVPPIKNTLADLGGIGGRVRYQARNHTMRVAHGLVELLRDYLASRGAGPQTLVVESVHEADPTDREFVAALMNRLRPEQLMVVVGTGVVPLLDPPGGTGLSLPEALAAHATILEVPTSAAAAAAADVDQASIDRYARAYIDSDGASDDPAERAAYDLLPAATRAAWHDERAAALVATGEPSWLRGAVPYHAERGSDPHHAGAAAIREAQVSCKTRGLYHAAAELGLRGRQLVDRDSQPDLWWDLTGDMTTSLGALGRADEALAHYHELRTLTDDPFLHMHISYGVAMLYARHYPEPQRDAAQARAWLNQAVALASGLDDPSERAYWSVFNRNGLALVDVRDGRPDDALNRLNEGIARLDRELAPDQGLVHRNGLRYNRAQVHMIAGRLEEALADFTDTIDRDPNFPDNYFHRANILARLGQPEEAIADYNRMTELTPPMSEVYYNRADTLADLGDLAGAVSDFERVIELDPANMDARVNRAELLCDLDEVEAAWSAVVAGLAHDDGNARLWCLRGRLLAERGERAAAGEALARALALDDRLAEAYALRGALAFERDEVAAAAEDLTLAIELSDRVSPELRYNRAVAYQAAGRLAEAAADYDAVLAQTDDPDARQRRDACLAAAAPARV